MQASRRRSRQEAGLPGAGSSVTISCATSSTDFAGGVNRVPSELPCQLLRVAQIATHGGHRGVALAGQVQVAGAGIAQFEQSVGRHQQAEHPLGREGAQAVRDGHVRHQRDVGRKPAAIGQVEHGGSLHRSGGPYQHDLRLRQVVHTLAVIMAEGKLDGLDLPLASFAELAEEPGLLAQASGRGGAPVDPGSGPSGPLRRHPGAWTSESMWRRRSSETRVCRTSAGRPAASATILATCSVVRTLP